MDPTLIDRVAELCASVMAITPPQPDDDLVASGHLDSLALVELLFEIEQKLDVTPSLDDLDLDNLRTPRSIAELVARWRGEWDANSEGVA
jgi:D-alanine--poly(phosphoribitol) ligase subunit 2